MGFSFRLRRTRAAGTIRSGLAGRVRTRGTSVRGMRRGGGGSLLARNLGHGSGKWESFRRGAGAFGTRAVLRAGGRAGAGRGDGAQPGTGGATIFRGGRTRRIADAAFRTG